MGGGGGGGGGAVKVAVKIARFSNNGGFNGSRAVHLSDHAVLPPGSRRGFKPVSATLTSQTTEDGNKPSVLVEGGGGDHFGETVRGGAMFDDWEFAGDEDEFYDEMNPVPRLVFGGVPSLEEAKEATSDLKEALEKVYSHPSDTSHESYPSLTSDPGYPETKACITSQSLAVTSALPKPVFQAFALLKGSPEAQSAVASLASDKNVWDAVLRNEKVLEFIKSQQTRVPYADMDMGIKDLFMDNEDDDEKGHEDDEEKGHDDSSNSIMDFIQKIKVTVTELASNLFGLVHNIFGTGSPSEENISIDANGTASATTTAVASVMGMAVLAIIVVLLKRG